MVGALNKLPVAASGMIFFGDPVTFHSVIAIMLGFVAGLVYSVGKTDSCSARFRRQLAHACPCSAAKSAQAAKAKCKLRTLTPPFVLWNEPFLMQWLAPIRPWKWASRNSLHNLTRNFLTFMPPLPSRSPTLPP